ncbi:sperm-associated antigen 1 [Musca domestica]|uniref:Sperm-associated antigen 1 n=1 Tax=Musca domestica TaxID=7370 RepID=A0A1I8N9J6_MUSDO|nr:sperm-associated antigen 1 [Musca domestica]
MSQPKRTLMERYGIPVQHLDFQYIAECKDEREIERIVHILRSGEEGYYPDLTKCAEEKLHELKPHSRLFRVEEHIRGREALGEQEWKPIYDWNHEIKTKDKTLQKLSKEKGAELDLPPVRQNAHISLKKPEDSKTNKNETNAADAKVERIKSTDYSKWDKYDAEEEILRLDLAEERIQEETERKNRLNLEKIKASYPKIEEILEEAEANGKGSIHALSDIEREKLSEDFRLRGNEYFRAKEYEFALAEYTKAIQVYPEKAVGPYNNRAVTYIKQQRFLEAIKDCEACLALDPKNLKARLRLAEASYGHGRRRESYQLYINVLEVDPQNSIALKAITELRKMFEDLPPPLSRRMQIIDEDSSKAATPKTNSSSLKTEIQKKTNTVSKKSTPEQSELKNYDLADLVKPNRLVKNKILKAAENFGKLQIKAQTRAKDEDKKEIETKEKPKEVDDTEFSNFVVPGNVRASGMGKILIEEI